MTICQILMDSYDVCVVRSSLSKSMYVRRWLDLTCIPLPPPPPLNGDVSSGSIKTEGEGEGGRTTAVVGNSAVWPRGVACVVGGGGLSCSLKII